ncbi:putative cytochrome P450 [Rosellinia necatrix]|uniref:Putative cytochrome P450 n=1 Tax=Rosellinia necatrix TaxID=77044 RepID=A0A1W2TU36_ROSNE|nr:putative cytochrome P450 [Rosellinia necatrix]
MELKTAFMLLCLVLATFFLFRRRRQRDAAARNKGCHPAVSHRPLEPFLGFDFQMKMYSQIPYLYQLHQKYGDTYQVPSLIGAPTICTIDPENIRTINTSKDYGVEPQRLPGLEKFCGRGFITTDGDIRRQARKLLKPSFDIKNVRDLGILRIETDKMFQGIRKGRTVDLQPLLYVMFLNSALHFVLGVSPSTQTFDAPSTADDFVKAFHSALFYSMFRVILGRAWNLLPQKKYNEVCTAAHSYLDYYINEALAGDAKQQSGSVIQGLSAQTEDLNFIRSQVIQAMMAAQDTTSELLTNALFVLARHPNYWEQLHSEFAGKPDEDFSADNLLKSKLIMNVLHETLRLYPIFPLLGRVALRDTILPAGGGPNHDHPIFVPKGSPVVMAYYALHRNTSVFGDDIEAFKPERWNSLKPRQWEFLGFGSGDRACLGQQKATIEAAYVLARFAREFWMLKSRDARDWKGELKLTCKSAHGCKVVVH